MENIEENNTNEPIKLFVTEDIRSYIYETAKWTKFLSIVGFIVSVMIIITAFSVSSLMNSMSAISGSMGSFAKMGGTMVTIIMFFYALVIFYPSMLLFKYANSARQAVLYGDQQALSVSASKLKSYFKFLGILTIVMIALYVLSLLLVLTGVAIS